MKTKAKKTTSKTTSSSKKATSKKTATKATKPAATKRAAKVQPATENATAGKVTRKDTILALIGKKTGATLAELMAACQWQAHSVRGFIATLGTKHGLKITSAKNEAGERTYTLAA